MNTVSILVSKEVTSIFSSWGIYFGFILFYLICGLHCWFSPENFFFVGQASMNQFFVVANWTIFLLIPALTMKSISDERKHGTLELLLSKPIVTSHLVSGKYFSQLFIGIGALVLTIPYYITLAMLGNIDHGATILGYYGLICIASCYISMGIFASSIARTPITAFCITLGLELCFFFFFKFIAEVLSSGFWADFFAYLSFDEHFEALTIGILDSRDIIYFASITTLFLVLSKYFICRSRY